MSTRFRIQPSAEKGFSMIELLIVLVILLTISAAMFQVIGTATQRSTTEQTKVDMFQEAREFMDQMSRDLRQAGYPNVHNYAASGLTVSPTKNDPKIAVGLVKVESGELWFEGDVDGSGTVSVIRYHVENTGTNCPCLQRSQVTKVNADPVTGQSESYQVEVQGVLHTSIFSARSEGMVVALPVSLTTATGTTIASIDTVQASLTLEAPVVDPQTHVKPVTTLVNTVRLNNCSQAAAGSLLSCN